MRNTTQNMISSRRSRSTSCESTIEVCAEPPLRSTVRSSCDAPFRGNVFTSDKNKIIGQHAQLGERSIPAINHTANGVTLESPTQNVRRPRSTFDAISRPSRQAFGQLHNRFSGALKSTSPVQDRSITSALPDPEVPALQLQDSDDPEDNSDSDDAEAGLSQFWSNDESTVLLRHRSAGASWEQCAAVLSQRTARDCELHFEALSSGIKGHVETKRRRGPRRAEPVPYKRRRRAIRATGNNKSRDASRKVGRKSNRRQPSWITDSTSDEEGDGDEDEEVEGEDLSVGGLGDMVATRRSARRIRTSAKATSNANLNQQSGEDDGPEAAYGQIDIEPGTGSGIEVGNASSSDPPLSPRRKIRRRNTNKQTSSTNSSNIIHAPQTSHVTNDRVSCSRPHTKNALSSKTTPTASHSSQGPFAKLKAAIKAHQAQIEQATENIAFQQDARKAAEQRCEEDLAKLKGTLKSVEVGGKRDEDIDWDLREWIAVQEAKLRGQKRRKGRGEAEVERKKRKGA